MEELLRILEKNARMPIEDIAAMLDKTPTEVAAMMDEATEKGYEVDGEPCDSCGTLKYKREPAECRGYLVCNCGPEIGSPSCQSGTLELFETCQECCDNKCTLDKCPEGAICYGHSGHL